jgi:hypothetical protein
MSARSSALYVVLAVVVAGCSKSADPNRPKTVPVTATVTYQGKPVEEATVMLIPTVPKSNGATGKSDASGATKFTTFDAGDGVVAGKYNVVISKTTVQGAPTEEESRKYVEKGQQPPLGKIVEGLPEKYKSETTSGLTADVAEGTTELKFDLK